MNYTYTLPGLVENAALQFPDKPAFRYLDKTLTYRELAQKMNQLANLLIELGVQKGDRVGIFMLRSLETAVAMYGIMQAGAVYVPVNPSQPKARTLFLLKDCGIQHIVTNTAQNRTLIQLVDNQSFVSTIIGTTADLPTQTIPWEAVSQMPDSSPQINILEQDLAYILYTSGSTGTPKGIIHTHYSGLSYARLSIEAYQLRASDIFGNHAPIYFDISTLGYFAAPMVGATTVIASEAHIKMPASLAQLIEKEAITIWYSVPLALVQLMQGGVLETVSIRQLRWIIFAGEAFPTKHLRKLMTICPHARFSNAYGPTETNVCTYYNLPEIPETDDPISIGKPWGNTSILIVNQKNESVKTGEAGELLVRSATLMEGYWGRSDLNRKAFFQQENAAGSPVNFYKTGDLVREEKDGNLTFLGRKDRQVKTRGFRVELDEISTFLMRNDAVEEAAVYTVVNEAEEVLIESAVILKEEKTATSEELLNYLKSYLPAYALPHAIILTDNFPRTPTGKMDLRAFQRKDFEQQTTPK